MWHLETPDGKIVTSTVKSTTPYPLVYTTEETARMGRRILSKELAVPLTIVED